MKFTPSTFQKHRRVNIEPEKQQEYINFIFDVLTFLKENKESLYARVVHVSHWGEEKPPFVKFDLMDEVETFFKCAGSISMIGHGDIIRNIYFGEYPSKTTREQMKALKCDFLFFPMEGGEFEKNQKLWNEKAALDIKVQKFR